MGLDKYQIGWWSCFISMYYESIGTKSDEVVDVIVGVAKAAKVTEKEIDDIIQLAKIEEKDSSNFEITSLVPIAKDCIEILNDKASDNNIQLHFN